MSLFEFMSVCPNGTKIILKDYNGENLLESNNKDELCSTSDYEIYFQHEEVDCFFVDCLGIYIKLKFLVDCGSIE